MHFLGKLWFFILVMPVLCSAKSEKAVESQVGSTQTVPVQSFKENPASALKTEIKEENKENQEKTNQKSQETLKTAEKKEAVPVEEEEDDDDDDDEEDQAKPADVFLEEPLPSELLGFQRGQGVVKGKMLTAYNVPGAFNLNNGIHTWTEAAYICWMVSEEHLDLARSNISSTEGSPRNQKYYPMSFNYRSGFKVGLGHFFQHDDWDVFVRYTWLDFKDKTTQAVNELVTLPSFYTTSTDTISGVFGSWKVAMNLLELELARSFYWGNHLIARPFVGPKGGWLWQQLYVRGTYFNNTLGTYYPYYLGTIDSWKIGARTGSDFTWFFTRDFHLSAKLAVSLLYSFFKTTFKNWLYSSTNGLYTLTSSKKPWVVQPVFETALGFGYGRYFGMERFHMDFTAVYEFQAFLSENQFLLENARPDKGGLYMHGLTVTFRLDF